MKNFDLFIDDLKSLIACKSVKSSPKENAPFGLGVKSAFDTFIKIANGMGFKVINYDDYIGEITVGSGEELGIIGHLDVVPEGSGWNTDPYTLTEIDDTFYGRGVLDDKAPLLLCLYAIKDLLDEGVEFNKKVRFFIGLDEETDWQDVNYFKEHYGFPKYGISPDGNFPVVYAEKGLNKVTFHLPKFKSFSNIAGGTTFNAVCGKCYVKPHFTPDAEELKNFDLTFDGENIVSIGKSCHGSRPWLGVNAMKKLFEYMVCKGEDLQNALDYLFNDKAKIFDIKNEQGMVTLSPNIVSEDDMGVHILCDVRVPAPKTLKELYPILDGFNIPYTPEIHREPLLVPKESEFVQTLLRAYNNATGENAEPESMSGGTFAYVFEQGCAFGPEFKGMDSGIHEANERAKKSELLRIYAVYKSAIKELVK